MFLIRGILANKTLAQQHKATLTHPDKRDISDIPDSRMLCATALGQFPTYDMMKRNLDDLTVTFSNSNSDRLTEDWRWLLGTDKKVLLISAIGDLFLTDIGKKVYWLDVGGGELKLVADTIEDFEEKLKNIEQVNEWFMIDLTTDLRLSDKKLKDGQLYSYKKLPILGGDYTVDNFEPTDIEVHFSFAGQIHRQIKDLPDGTRIDKIKFVD